MTAGARWKTMVADLAEIKNGCAAVGILLSAPFKVHTFVVSSPLLSTSLSASSASSTSSWLLSSS
jgi:hypothetical protein